MKLETNKSSDQLFANGLSPRPKCQNVAARSRCWLNCFRHVRGIAANALFAVPAVLIAQVTNYLPNGPDGFVIQGITLNNSIAEQLPNPTVGTLIFTLNPGCPFYQVNQFVSGGWIDPGQRLVPGQGVLTWNPGPATNLVSVAQPATVGQYAPAQVLNLFGLLPGDAMPAGVAGDILRSITVVSNRWQTSEIARGSGAGWAFIYGDENTLRNGFPFFLETYDPLKPLGDCPSSAIDGDILLNSYAPASSTTGTVEVVFYGEPIIWSLWRAQVYGAISNEETFAAIGPVLAIQPEGLNGKVVLPGPQAISMQGTGILPGQEAVLELRIWDTMHGGSYEVADLASSYGHGRSPARRIVTRSDFSLPPTPVNLNQFSVQLSVPLTPPLEIFFQPSSPFIATGVVAKFETSVVSYSQDVTLQWQKLSATGIWQDLLGETAATLAFPAASKAQQGQYRLRAIAHFMDGSSTTRISQVARLRVANPPVLGIVRASPTAIALSINVDPEYSTTIERRTLGGAWMPWQQLPTGSSFQTFQLDPLQPTELFRARTFP